MHAIMISNPSPKQRDPTGVCMGYVNGTSFVIRPEPNSHFTVKSTILFSEKT